MNIESMELDLVLNNDKQYRSLAEKDIDTFQAKKNKVIIASPICTEIIANDSEGSLTVEIASAYPGYSFYKLLLSLTLLPDTDCRFSSVDFMLELLPKNTGDKQPLFILLQPESLQSEIAVTISSTTSGKIGVNDNALKILSTEVSGTDFKEQKFERMESKLSSFGKRSNKAGWRFTLTNAADIPISSPDLYVVVAVPQNKKASVGVRVTANIKILDATDNFLSMLFLRKPSPLLADFEIPETIDQ
jgi:hypothetical protein